MAGQVAIRGAGAILVAGNEDYGSMAGVYVGVIILLVLPLGLWKAYELAEELAEVLRGYTGLRYICCKHRRMRCCPRKSVSVQTGFTFKWWWSVPQIRKLEPD